MNKKDNLKLWITHFFLGFILITLSPIAISDCIGYKPLQRGLKREGLQENVRGICKSLSSVKDSDFLLSVIAPERTGKTFTSQPPLYWWTSHPLDALFRFSWVQLTDDGEAIENTYKEATLKLSVEAGIQKFPLNKLIGDKVLEEGQYNWSVRLLCAPPNITGEDRFSSGTILYEKPAKEVSTLIKQMDEQEFPCFCLDKGFWYDAFHAVQESQNKEFRSELLERENLDQLLPFDR